MEISGLVQEEQQSLPAFAQGASNQHLSDLGYRFAAAKEQALAAMRSGT